MSLTARDRASYGLGGAVYAVKEAAYIMFVLLFYTQVLGLSGTATGVVLFLAIVWDAVSDPLVGTWSDRFKSRWGRRHPFMIASVLPLALGFVALFWPPDLVKGDMNYLGVWLLFWSLWIRTALTLFSIPHISLTAEITQDYNERSRLLSLRTAFLFLVGLLLPAICLSVLFSETDGVDGRFVVDNYITYGWLSALIVCVAAFGAIAGTWKYIDNSKGSVDAAERTSLRVMWRDFRSTFGNKNFRNVLYYDLGASASYGITVALNIIIWTYFWELDANETALTLGLSVVLAVVIALLSLGPISRHWPKHRIIRYAVIIMLVDLLWLFPLRLFDIIPANGHPLIFALIIVQNTIFMTFFILRIIAIGSITADLTDEHESETGRRQEGGFFSVLLFTTKLGTAAGPLYGGIALDLVGLKEGMPPGTISQTMLNNLMWVKLAAIVPLMLVTWWFSLRFSMTEDQLLEIQRKITARKV